MKVLALNGSPRGEHSCTYRILHPLLTGMRQAGADAEIINLSNFTIKECFGYFACWTKTPGKCVIEDDMEQFLIKMRSADFVIYGTPLYSYHMTGLLKIFMDRRLPLLQPFMERNNDTGTTKHPRRYASKSRKILLVSPCGFPEFTHFDALVYYFKYFAKLSGDEYVGEILRPTGEVLRDENFQMKLKPYYDNLILAGKQLVLQGKIDPELHAELHKLFITPEEFRVQANKSFQNAIN